MSHEYANWPIIFVKCFLIINVLAKGDDKDDVAFSMKKFCVGKDRSSKLEHEKTYLNLDLTKLGMRALGRDKGWAPPLPMYNKTQMLLNLHL